MDIEMWDNDFRPGAEIAVYYPTMVPPSKWLRYALLMYDEVASLVPQGFTEFEVGNGFRWKEIDPERNYSDEFRWAVREGAWRPLSAWPNARDESNESGLYRQEIASVLRHFERSRSTDGPYDSRSGYSVVLKGKLNPDIYGALLDAGLGIRRDIGHGIDSLVVDKAVLSAIMSITAKYVAWANDNIDTRFVPFTDDLTSASTSMDPSTLRRRVSAIESRNSCRLLLLRNLIPTPADSVSLQEIIAYRREHRDELLSLRTALDDFANAVLESDDPVDALRSNRSKIEQEVQEIYSAARKRKVSLVLGGLLIATTGAYARMEPESLTWILSGVGVTVTAKVVGLMTGGLPRPTSSPFSYVFGARETFSTAPLH
jgi:hypothetical protein